MCIIFALFWSLSCHPHHWLSLGYLLPCAVVFFFKPSKTTLTFRSLKRVVRFKGWSFARCFGMVPLNLGSFFLVHGPCNGGRISILSVRRLPKYPQKLKKGYQKHGRKVNEATIFHCEFCVEKVIGPIWTIDGLMGCWFQGLTAFDSAPEK